MSAIDKDPATQKSKGNSFPTDKYLSKKIIVVGNYSEMKPSGLMRYFAIQDEK